MSEKFGSSVRVYTPSDFNTHTLEFSPGDRIVLVADGVLEAMCADGLPFGERRLVEALHRTDDRRPAEVVRQITQDVLTFRDGALADDATAVCVDYRRR